MTVAQWFASVYRRADEPRYRAIQRLSLETGLGWTTILRAVSGSRLTMASAERLSLATGGQVSVIELITAPTRRELRDEKPSEPPPPSSGEEAAE